MKLRHSCAVRNLQERLGKLMVARAVFAGEHPRWRNPPNLIGPGHAKPAEPYPVRLYVGVSSNDPNPVVFTEIDANALRLMAIEVLDVQIREITDGLAKLGVDVDGWYPGELQPLSPFGSGSITVGGIP